MNRVIQASVVNLVRQYRASVLPLVVPGSVRSNHALNGRTMPFHRTFASPNSVELPMKSVMKDLKMLARHLITVLVLPRTKTICPPKKRISSAIPVHATPPSVVPTPTGLTLVNVAPLVVEVFNREQDVLSLQTMLLQINVRKRNNLVIEMNVQNGLHGKHGQLVMVHVPIEQPILLQREQDIDVGIRKMAVPKPAKMTPVAQQMDAIKSKKKSAILNFVNLNASGQNGVHGVFVLLTVPRVFRFVDVLRTKIKVPHVLEMVPTAEFAKTAMLNALFVLTNTKNVPRSAKSSARIFATRLN